MPTSIPALQYFKTTDFDCTCGCGRLPGNDLMILVDNIRHAFGKPIQVSSGSRCETKNKSIGGALHSRHVVGDACDLVRNEPLRKFLEANLQVFKICMEDPNSTAGWLHLDMLNRNGWRVFQP